MRAHEVLADRRKIALNENEAARSLKVLALADQDHGPVPARNVMFGCAEPRRGGRPPLGSGSSRPRCARARWRAAEIVGHVIVEVLCGLGQSSNSILAVKVGAMLLVPCSSHSSSVSAGPVCSDDVRRRTAARASVQMMRCWKSRIPKRLRLATRVALASCSGITGPVSTSRQARCWVPVSAGSGITSSSRPTTSRGRRTGVRLRRTPGHGAEEEHRHASSKGAWRG